MATPGLAIILFFTFKTCLVKMKKARLSLQERESNYLINQIKYFDLFNQITGLVSKKCKWTHWSHGMVSLDLSFLSTLSEF